MLNLTRRVKRMLTMAVMPVIAVAFVMSAAPAAQAAPVAPATQAAAIDQILTPAEKSELIRSWTAAQGAGQVGGPQRAVPAIVLGAIIVCSATALGSVGEAVVENYIADGNPGKAKDLLAKAIAGCVFGVVTGGAGALCKAFPPCRKAAMKAFEKAAQKIIDGLS